MGLPEREWGQAAGQIVIAWIGRTRDRSLDVLCTRYVERARRLGPIRLRLIESSWRGGTEDRRSVEEAAALARVGAGARKVLLSPRGTNWSSEELARYVAERLQASEDTVVALGSEVGLRPVDEAWADQLWSLGRATLPHELARLVVVEQLYRALTIVRNIKYHK